MIQGTVVVLGLCFITGSYQISVEQARALSRISNITQLFSEAQIMLNGRVVDLYDVLPNIGYSGEQTYVGPGFPDLAMPDECQPRLTTVEIPRDIEDDANVMYWPKCTRIPRCGGCCANNMLRCVPAVTETRAFTVLKVRLWDSNSADLDLDWEGVVTVEMQEHVECRIMCSITAADCNRKQSFDEFDCSCRCRETKTCSPVKRWDPETCRCVCKDENRSCGPGQSFSPSLCSCRIHRADWRYSNLEIDGDEGVANAAETSTVTAAPTTESTTAATTVHPCASHFCPPHFEKILNDEGQCVCNPTFSFPGK